MDDFTKILCCGAQTVHLLVFTKSSNLRLLYPKILSATIKFLDKISLLRKFYRFIKFNAFSAVI